LCWQRNISPVILQAMQNAPQLQNTPKGQPVLLTRFMLKHPKVHEFGATFFTCLPLPLSKHVYRFMRRFVFRDNDYRLDTFNAAFAAVAQKGVPVDYLEFGVGRGTSIITAYEIGSKHGLKCRFFAFDSFQGLPSSEGNVFEKGEYSYPRKHFESMVSKAGVPMDRVHITQGFYDQSLTPELYTKLGLRRGVYCAHLDCDLYESAKPALQWLMPLMDSGSVIIFDDWFRFDAMPDPENYGEQRAFREFADRANWKLLFMKRARNVAFVRN
jgi:hypothetical protein